MHIYYRRFINNSRLGYQSHTLEHDKVTIGSIKIKKPCLVLLIVGLPLTTKAVTRSPSTISWTIPSKDPNETKWQLYFVSFQAAISFCLDLLFPVHNVWFSSLFSVIRFKGSVAKTCQPLLNVLKNSVKHSDCDHVFRRFRCTSFISILMI